MDASDELGYLADDDDLDEATDLTTVLSLARDGADVSCEGEQEGEEWAFHVGGFSAEELLPLVQGALPEGWEAKVVPVPADVLAGAQITISRR